MRDSSLALLFGALVFCTGLWVLMHDTESGLRQAVDDALEQGQALMNQYHSDMEDRMTKALAQLFEELDKDSDGCIRRDEFGGASIGVMAAMRSMDIQRPRIPTPRLPTTTRDVIWLFQVVFTLQIMTLCGLFILVHLHALIFGVKPSVDLSIDYINATPRKISKAEALKASTPMSKVGLYERIKMGFFILSGLAAVRFFFVVCFFVLGVFGISMAVLGGRTRRTHPRWFGFWDSVVCFAGSMIFISLGFSRVVSHGQLPEPSKRKIFVGNHICVVEVVYLFVHASMPSFVSRVENLNIPLFPAIAKASDALMVDRDAAASREQTLRTILDRAKDPKAVPLMVFPEGTCNAGSGLFQFKRGAFECGEPVQMVCFKFSGKHFKPSWSGRAVGGNDLIDLILRMVCQFRNDLEVVFLPMYHPTAEERADPIKYATHVQYMMANVLKEPVSDTQYADYVELIQAKREAKRAKKPH